MQWIGGGEWFGTRWPSVRQACAISVAMHVSFLPYVLSVLPLLSDVLPAMPVLPVLLVLRAGGPVQPDC